jgi:hypothetical protein
MNDQTGIRKDAQLKVHIVDALNLPKGENTTVVVEQGGTQAETDNAVSGENPIWNEAIIFKISNPHEPLILTIRS